MEDKNPYDAVTGKIIPNYELDGKIWMLINEERLRLILSLRAQSPAPEVARNPLFLRRLEEIS